MYETILVAYDGSEYSRAGLKEACAWIKRHGGTLFLMHVIYFNEEEFLLYPDIREKRFEQGKKLCDEAKAEITKHFGIQAQCILKEGDPSEAILHEAETLKAKLIVTGTYGKKGLLKRLVLGSVSTELALNSPIDVLVVKKPCEECKGDYNSILVPFDDSVASRLALKKAFRFYNEYGSSIHVCYILPRYQELIEFYITPSIKEKIIVEGKKILSSAENMAKEAKIPIELIMDEGSPAEKIVEIAERKKIDLLIIGPYGWKKGLDRKLIGSTTEKILHLINIPVLIAKEE
ncbi:uspA domain-containing protein [Caldimicrobium thiodismutans]|jgi:nucleotide-binding universal stress UspA family protein|uniref:UspA domain-containing protein n=1 Tax=Caldimicrobium thiodismutans TaxID=1653476 RepID=A0A0U5AW28_9BACT|nr:universal stress protein [Caldimicrobium thiodismutans]BAU22766.1 uspA domain-containing protein [Caldimicrobium thiodismutans]